MQSEYYGCWPTMITPFTDGNEVDYEAIKQIVEWYIDKGCNGIFAVCQSSEMFFLTREEKVNIARAVVEAVKGRVKVIASGHTEESIEEQIEGLRAMSQTGVDAVVLVSNRLAKEDESDEVLKENAEKIFKALPDVKFGMYECPYPYLRLISNDFLKYCADFNKLMFLKDVCCSTNKLIERIHIVKDSQLKLFNANTATLLQSLKDGINGYNGVMANYHLDLYTWLYHNYKEQPELAEKVNNFLTLSGVVEARAYPISAKYHMNLEGIKMSLHTRVKSPKLFNENAQKEIDALYSMEKQLREVLFK